MEIAQVSATFPPYMAGTGNVCYHYATELANLGYEVTAFTGNYICSNIGVNVGSRT